MKKLAVILAMGVMFVACSGNKTTDSDKNSLTSNDFANDTCEKIDTYLTKLSQEKNFSGGFLIIKNGKKLFSKGYGWADKNRKTPFTPRTLASMGSITKAFTAAAIMKLCEQGKLKVDDNLKKYFPTIPSDKESVTIHQLLTHSSGFHEFLKQDGGDYEKIETNEFLKRAFSEPLAFKPGEKAVYTNVGMSILAIIIEKVSGLDYEKYLQTNLFDPIGIKKIGYRYPLTKDDTIAIGYQNGNAWGTHQSHFEKVGGGPYWNLKGNGGLEVSLDEMYLWLNSFTNNTILKKESIEKMFTAHAQEEGYNGESFFGYGCNISKSRRNTKMIDNGGSNGIYFARIVRLPEEGVVFFMITNESSINTSMVLPNISQLYFLGKIEQDALTMNPKFDNEISKQVYEIVNRSPDVKLEEEFMKAKIAIEDDMVLLEVGQKLIQEDKALKALNLYKYYTKIFPKIVVAWNDMGDIYLSENKKEEAMKCYKQALKIKPENSRAKESLSKLSK